MSYRAVIFDLDGTLLDTLEDIADAANNVLAARDLPRYPLDDYRYFVGDGVGMLAKRILPEDQQDDDTITALLQEYRAEYGRNWKAKTKPYDGIPEMLDGLTAHGVTLAVLSNKPDDFTKLCVDALLPKWTFADVVGRVAGVPLKPDPTSALQMMERLALTPAETLYLGDTAVDMETATAAGMFPVGALWGFREREELERSGAKIVIEKPQEIMDLL